MIYPAPTTPIDPGTARGVFAGLIPATATAAAHIALEVPNTNYQLHLVPAPGSAITALPGKRLIGVIRAMARRVDVVDTGGMYLEPVIGRPRRVQGRVLAIFPEAGTILVNAGVPIHLRLTDSRQRPGDFAIGDLVSTDVLDGAVFEAR
jgi:hypothetical protein